MSDAELAALGSYRESPLFDYVERLILDLAVAMSQTPATVPEQLRVDLLQHLSRAQLAEVAATIAWENHRARLNRALDVRAAGFSEDAYCVLPTRPAASAEP